MALIRFDQDPELQPGAGIFHADDGSSFPAYDPEMARHLSRRSFNEPNELDAPPPPGYEDSAPVIPTRYENSPDGRDQFVDDRINWDSDSAYAAMRRGSDERTAGIGTLPPTEARLAAGGQEAPGVAPPVASDVQPNMSVQPAMVSEGTPGPRQSPPQSASPALGQADELQGNIDRYAMRPVVEKAHRGGVLPTTQQETRESSGMPYDPNGPEAMARADASINVNMAGSNKANAEAARAAGEAAAYQAALPRLQEQARVAQMRRDMQERQYRRDREDLERLTEESNKSAKSFDANRWFTERGAVGQIGAAIAQAFGAGAATLAGGPNMVLNQINGYIDRDIATQRAQIEAGKDAANNQLAVLNRQFGNLDQAEAALKIAQQKKVETMAASYAASTKSEDIQNSLNVWLADNEQRRVAAEQQFQNAAYGKTSVTTAAKVIPASAGGQRAPTEKEVQQRYETLDKRGKVVEGTYEGEIKRQKALGMDPEKADKTRELVVENLDGSQALARKPDEATKIREMKSLHTNASGSLAKLKGLAKSGNSLSPDDLRAVDLNIEAVVNGANTIAGQNAVKGEDMERYKKALQNKVGAMPAEKALEELQDILDRSYQARVDAQRGSAVKEVQTGKGAQVQYTGGAAKNPTAKGQFRQVGR